MDWKYRCVDMREYYLSHFSGESGITVHDIEVYRESFNDIWIDEVVIAGTATVAEANWQGTCVYSAVPSNLN